MSAARVAYAYSEELIKAWDTMPMIAKRASMTDELIRAYNLHEHMLIIEPEPASIDDMTNFHAKGYIETLKALSDEEDPEKIDPQIMEEYGLEYDCPIEPGLFEKVSLMVGATLAATESLCRGEADVAINWCGGWHHAKRFEAAGYSYVNDIVLAVQVLRAKYGKVLYVDLDLHHGDGVEEAFYSTNKVLTMSFHKRAAGFYPGSGAVTDTGEGNGGYYSINVPFSDGITTEVYVQTFETLLPAVVEAFSPGAIVCQCGADGLAFDPSNSFNLSSDALVKCTKLVLKQNKPTLLLGGGGYDLANTSRCWTLLTAAVCGKELAQDIPDSVENFMAYSPDFTLDVPAGNRRDTNHQYTISAIIRTVKANLLKISPVVELPER